MRVSIVRPWNWAVLAVALFAVAGVALEGSAERAEPQSVLVREFRLYPPGDGGQGHELVSEFLGRWLNSRLPAAVSYNSTGEPPGLNTMSALTAAVATWNNIPGHYFQFNARGATTVPQPFHPDTGCAESKSFDEINTVRWSPDWGDSELLAVACLFGVTLGDDPKPRVTGFDIWIRADAPWSSSGAPDAFDLPSILLHELGHALGLGHDPDPSTVMSTAIDLGQQIRTPTTEDVAGVLTLYASSLRRVIPALARQ